MRRCWAAGSSAAYSPRIQGSVLGLRQRRFAQCARELATGRSGEVLGGNPGRRREYFDPLAFAPVTQARFGTAGFDLLRGPGTVNLDASLFRSFKFTERW